MATRGFAREGHRYRRKTERELKAGERENHGWKRENFKLCPPVNTHKPDFDVCWLQIKPRLNSASHHITWELSERGAMAGYPAAARTESTHHRLIDFAKTALTKIFLFPYATVCELYCGQVPDVEKFDEALIGHYIGIDACSSGISQVREAWESQRKSYTSDFFELDPCTENLEPHLLDKANTVDVVCCMHHLQICFESEDRAKVLLHNVSSLLKPGGYFIGITPDSSMIWAKYQKNVEAAAYHNRSGAVKPNIVPNCIRSESYMITFEGEDEKFPLFGKKYQLKFASDVSAETHCLVHFPSFIRLAREAGLEYVEIQNLTEFYDDNRAQLASLILKFGPNLVDPRGRLLPRSFDVLGLYTTFIFQKPDPDMAPPITTPVLPEGTHIYDDASLLRDWQATTWRDDEKPSMEPPPPPPPPGLGKISDQKGILGPGPPELRFPEAL